MTPTLKAAIELMMEKAEKVMKDYYIRMGFTHSEPTLVRMNELSSKWCKIEKLEHCRTDTKSESSWRHDYSQSVFEIRNGDLYRVSSVYAFVALTDFSTKFLGQVKTGNIHMAATSKAPAKHARGSVFGNMDCLGPHGIAYLR